MLERKDLLQLTKIVAHADPKSTVAYSFGEDKFNYSELNNTLRDEFQHLASSYALYRENRNTIFSLIEETIDDILPAKVLEAYGQFAEVKQFKQGDKPIFTQKITHSAKMRAKKFVTKVGLAGIYEVFKLDKRSYEVPTEAWGGAAQVGFEEFLDGRINFADLIDVLMVGLNEAVYREIEKALIASVANLQAANKHTDTGFNEQAMDRLLQVADAYGHSAIYCTYEFAAKIVPNTDGWVSDNIADVKWAKGYLPLYKGHNVILLPQSFEDETNSVKTIEPGYAWIIPVGAEKPVKIAFEGQTCIRDVENDDWSRDFQMYKKFGVAAIIRNNICVYQDTSLTK